MDALTALHTRTSANLLEEPGPNKEQLNSLIQAGLRACDHGRLTPWKFILIDNEQRADFGNLMVKAKTAADNGCELPIDFALKLKQKPFRAPVILAVAAELKEHPKVPEIEQILSAGAAAQMIVTAAYAMGLGAIWRSGSLMFEPTMREGLGLDENHRLVGLIYLGTPKVSKEAPHYKVSDYLENWKSQIQQKADLKSYFLSYILLVFKFSNNKKGRR